MELQEKKSIEAVVRFIDSMEDKYDGKISEEIKENNEKWLEDWVKSEKKKFNKNFYNEANEKVEKVMKELDKQECKEDEIEEMISRVNCFTITRNDVPSSLSFVSTFTIFLLTILKDFFPTLILKIFPCIGQEWSIIISLLILLGIIWQCVKMILKDVQKMIFRKEILNLLKEKLEKKKEKLKRGNEKE